MKRIFKMLSVFLALALLLPLVSAAPQSPTANLQRSGELAEGVYTLRNLGDGKLLNTFNIHPAATAIRTKPPMRPANICC